MTRYHTTLKASATVLAIFGSLALSLSACRQQPKYFDNTPAAWYKQQIIYNLDVKVFKDSDGNGIGDFNG